MFRGLRFRVVGEGEFAWHVGVHGAQRADEILTGCVLHGYLEDHGT